MNGLYIYCIKNKTGRNTHAKEGIEAKSTVTGISYKDIEAVVSAVDTEEYSSKEFTRRAQEDVQWIIQRAQKHEKVIEAVMGISKHNTRDTVIPMKFGTIFKTPQNVEDMLKKEYRKCRILLNDLQGKQEWGVSVYVKETALKKTLQATEQNVHMRIEQTKHLPRGADYFGELEVQQELDNAMQEKIEHYIKKFSECLGAHAVESRQHSALSRESSGHTEPMVLHNAYAVHENNVPDFINRVQSLRKSHPEFIFEYTGPWPPYNFVT